MYLQSKTTTEMRPVYNQPCATLRNMDLRQDVCFGSFFQPRPHSNVISYNRTRNDLISLTTSKEPLGFSLTSPSTHNTTQNKPMVVKGFLEGVGLWVIILCPFRSDHLKIKATCHQIRQHQLCSCNCNSKPGESI